LLRLAGNNPEFRGSDLQGVIQADIALRIIHGWAGECRNWRSREMGYNPALIFARRRAPNPNQVLNDGRPDESGCAPGPETCREKDQPTERSKRRPENNARESASRIL